MPPPDPADIAALRAQLVDLGARSDIDIAVECALSLEDPLTIPATVAALDHAGVTWILEAFPPGSNPERVAGVVRKGPPAAP